MRAIIRNKDDDEIICKDIDVSFERTINPDSGRSGWSGDFFLPQGEYVDPGNYTLQLEDCRQGGIVISPVDMDFSPGVTPTLVHFRLQGDWLNPNL
jgi:hypothetical protein